LFCTGALPPPAKGAGAAAGDSNCLPPNAARPTAAAAPTDAPAMIPALLLPLVPLSGIAAAMHAVPLAYVFKLS